MGGYPCEVVMKKIAYILLVLGLATAVSGVSLGVSPSRMIFDDMIMGQTKEARLAISTSGGEDLDLLINLDFPAGWVHMIAPENKIITESEIFTLRAKSQSSFLVVAQIPDVDKGKYTGNIEIIYDPKGVDIGGSSARIITRTVVPIEVIVTNQPNPAYRVVGVTVTDTKQREDIEVLVVMVNEGNVGIIPKVIAKIVNKEGDVVKTVEEGVILPTERGDHTFGVKVPTEGIEPGIYTAQITTKLDEETVSYDTRTFGIITVVDTAPTTTTIPQTTTSVVVVQAIKPPLEMPWQFIVIGVILITAVGYLLHFGIRKTYKGEKSNKNT